MKFKVGDIIVDPDMNSLKFMVLNNELGYKLKSLTKTHNANLADRLSSTDIKYIEKYYTWDTDFAKVLYTSTDK